MASQAPRPSLSEQRNALKEVSLFNLYLIWDTFSFRWMLVDYERESDVKSKCAARQGNIGVISALLFTVWASYLYDSPKQSSISIGGYDIGKLPEGVYYVLMIYALYCSIFAVFTATILYVLLDGCSNDTQARKFLFKVGHFFRAPMMLLVLGSQSGLLGVFAWFLMEVDIYSWFIMVCIGWTAITFLLVLSVYCIKHYYECKLEDEEPLPSQSLVRCKLLDVYQASLRTLPAGSAFPTTSAAPSSPSTPAPASIGLSLLPVSRA